MKMDLSIRHFSCIFCKDLFSRKDMHPTAKTVTLFLLMTSRFCQHPLMIRLGGQRAINGEKWPHFVAVFSGK